MFSLTRAGPAKPVRCTRFPIMSRKWIKKKWNPDFFSFCTVTLDSMEKLNTGFQHHTSMRTHLENTKFDFGLIPYINVWENCKKRDFYKNAHPNHPKSVPKHFWLASCVRLRPPSHISLVFGFSAHPPGGHRGHFRGVIFTKNDTFCLFGRPESVQIDFWAPLSSFWS